jgi:hypothetical protein
MGIMQTLLESFAAFLLAHSGEAIRAKMARKSGAFAV